MKFENLMLHSLFVATSVICALILGAMLHTGLKVTPQTTGQQLSAVLGSAPGNYSLMADGVVCARPAGVSGKPTQA